MCLIVCIDVGIAGETKRGIKSRAEIINKWKLQYGV